MPRGVSQDIQWNILTRNLNIFPYMPRFLRSVRLALHPAQRINQHFLRDTIECRYTEPNAVGGDSANTESDRTSGKVGSMLESPEIRVVIG